MKNFKMRHVLVNSGWNLVGLILPILAAVAAIPWLLSNMGTARFGALSLVWVIIGYFALFDLGLGRAVTKELSERGHLCTSTQSRSICLTSMCIAGGVGCIGALLVIGGAYFGSFYEAYLPIEIKDELSLSILWVGLCIPMTVLTAVLRGILEGGQRFRMLNLIRGPLGALLFILPALGSFIDSSLTMAVAMTVAARSVMLGAHYLPCRDCFIWQRRYFSRRWFKPLLEFGGWFTVSNLVGPVIVYMDRFFLAAIVPFATLAYYTAPFELVSKVLNIPVALTSALFPALNSIKAQGGDTANKAKALAQKIIFPVMAVIVLVGAGVSHPVLKIWLGADFAAQSTGLMQWLLIGFGFNAMAQVTYVSLQSENRTRSVAFLHLLELPVYGALLWGFISTFGMLGAAIAWAVRSLIDWMCLELILSKVRSGEPGSVAGYGKL